MHLDKGATLCLLQPVHNNKVIPAMAHQPIADYGIIGNMHTIALVSKQGAIDWFCPRKFDDASIFARLLDNEKGGHFTIHPPDNANHKQFYWPDTNVLVTRFLCEGGVIEVTDYMPVGVTDTQQQERWLVRQVRLVRGHMRVSITCDPAFNYARDDHELRISEHGAAFDSDTYSFALSSGVPLQAENGAAVATIPMEQGDTVIFTLTHINPGDDPPPPLTPQDENQLADETIQFWREWLSQCTYKGRWREIVYRSALVMKLLTYEPTGAIVAAPTTSLPETPGGSRNWDYRYSWLRDAAFTLYGFLRIGFTEEAGAFMAWLRKRIHEPHEGNAMPLQIMYTIDGDHDIPERTLEHLAGYKQSKPVRVGNAAHDQLQLDIFGELMDSIYLYNKYGQKISQAFWEDIVKLMNWVADNWQHQDKGIWEIRGVDQPFTYSKLMCWVALDRAARLAQKRSLPAPRERWLTVRDRIYNEIIECGWSEEQEAFVQYYGGETLDASNLLMPLVFFMAPTDPMMLKTLDAIMRPPRKGGLLTDSLVYRYDTAYGVDGLDGEEGTFNMCTFWLVEALTRAGRIDEARRIFEQMLAYANHLGLYAEETGMQGEALGNFPQAFTHLSLISAAYNLDLALDGKKWAE